jgi:hypothetical protein
MTVLYFYMYLWNKNEKSLIKVFLEKNSQINLSAIRDEQGVYDKHIRDALEVSKVFDFQPGMQVCDVGTGWWISIVAIGNSISWCAFYRYGFGEKKTWCDLRYGETTWN